jgi:hypothetical protein
MLARAARMDAKTARIRDEGWRGEVCSADAGLNRLFRNPFLEMPGL